MSQAFERVDQVLGRSRARQERRAALGDGLALVQWSNAHDNPSYRQPGHHTLSVYLEGGYGTRARGVAGEGSPGCHCILPAEHESDWVVGSGQRFVHLYWSPLAWSERGVRLLDAEPRALTLPTRLFGQDPALAAWAQQLRVLDWDEPAQRLLAQAASHAALDRLLLQAATPAQRQGALRAKGGLSGVARRRVLAYIDAHLDAPSDALSLASLAALVNLSEFHFARMFRVSMACSPHEWIAQQRLRRAVAGLQQSQLPLAELAARCGYASPSHLSHAVRRAHGLTPRELRRLLSEATRPGACA